MDPTLIVEYATEGAPMLLADTTSAAHWRGREDDGSGVVVEFMGQGVEKLPKEMLQTSKPGRQVKKFKSLEGAREFEKKVIDALKQMHPKAAKHPRFPDQPAYYDGPTRVFSVETKFTSMLDTVLQTLKADVQVLVFDKKRRAEALFIQQRGGGRGLIVADLKVGIIIAKFHHGAPDDLTAVSETLVGIRVPKAKAKMALDGRLFVFDSGQSQHGIGETNWQRPSLGDAVGPPFDRQDGGPLRIPGQQTPGGAFVRLPAGDYGVSYDETSDVAGGANVTWLIHRS